MKACAMSLMLATWLCTGTNAAGAGFEACTLGGTGGPAVAAECQTLAVALDPEDAGAGSIALFVARIPSINPAPAADPVVLVAGGPGQAGSDFYVSIRPAFEAIRRDRDIIVVDQRGTGLSVNGLSCPDAATGSVELLPTERLTQLAVECRAALAADPRWFTTSMAVRDLEAVRVALGIETWNLYGVSYGTRVVQHYLRRYPEAVRAVILDGVVPSGLVLGPQMGRSAAQVIEAISARCAADAACAAAFGDVSAKLTDLVARFGEDGLLLQVRGPRDGRPTEVRLSGPTLGSAVRFLSYSTQTASLLPLLIHAAAQGDPGPLAAQAQLVAEQLGQGLSLPMQAAVICSEDAPYFGDLSANERDPVARFGLDLLPPLRALCAGWPRGFVDTDLNAPLSSSKPVLLLSGELDPVTPPGYAQQAVAQGLTNAAHLVGAGQGHGMAPVGCVPRLMREFLARPEPTQLDSSCLQRLGAAPFFLGFNGPGA